MSFQLSGTGRSGDILYTDGSHSLRIYWEMSGSPEFDLLLAPIDLSHWSNDKSAIPVAKQLEILGALRAWLLSRGLRSDVDLPQTTKTSSDRCKWHDCANRQLDGLAYCAAHFDLAMLR
jgi:hypothetical protein